MKKLFTLAAAVLASFSLCADDATFTMSDIFDGSNQSAEVSSPVDAVVSTTASKSNAANGKLGSDGNYFEIVLSSETFSAASMNGYINTTSTEKNWAFQFSSDNGATWSEEVTQANDGDKTAHDIAVEVAIPEGANGFRVIRRAGTSTIVNSITLTIGGSAPVANDSISSVVISGPEAAFVGQAALFTAEFNVRPTAIKWFVNGEEQEGANAVSFTFTPAEEGSYSISCSAKNNYNIDFVASNVAVLEVSARPELEQVSISETTYWSWEFASELNEIKFTASTTPAKNERVLLANVEGMNNNENFNSQALLFEGEYAKRVQSGMPLCQGQLLQFNTTVPGYVTVEYSNTGNRSAAEGEEEGQESERRFVTVNGNIVGAGSMVSNELSFVMDVPVEAGDVTISALRPYSDNPTAIQYVRFYKIVFSTTPLSPASSVENTNADVKAVKVVRNGQLFIEKNGVVYNAQGAVVK